MQQGVSVPGAPAEPVSEDCLTLNVWTPAQRRGNRLPVMVWIPGGGFTQQSASMPLYWGDHLARRDVVVITINYRVGVFGFLAHPDLTREDPRRTSGNYGLWDIVEALRFVRRNARAFGGDEDRITIWGQSAGAMLVSMLMASPPAEGLFHRAIAQSGGFFAPPEATTAPETWRLAGAEQQGARFVAAAGSGSLMGLRDVAAADVLQGAARMSWHPIIDGVVLPEEPFTVFSAGKQARIPLLLGANADEGRSFIAGQTITPDSFVDAIVKRFGERLRNVAAQFLAIYPASNADDARRTRAMFEGALRFGWDMWRWARLHHARGLPVYYYRFGERDSPTADAGHWAELPFVFGRPVSDGVLPDTDLRLAQTMGEYWTNFARSGDPNSRRLPNWPRYLPERTGLVMHFTDAPGARPLSDVRGLEALDKFFASLRTSDALR
jgi:para-nitrobenzyl esterase